MIVQRDIKEKTSVRFSQEDIDNIKVIAKSKKLYRKDGTFSMTKAVRLALKITAQSVIKE